MVWCFQNNHYCGTLKFPPVTITVISVIKKDTKTTKIKKKFNHHKQNRKIIFGSDIKRNFQYILSPAEQKEITKLREVFFKNQL